MPKVSFDGPNRIISVNAGETSVDVKIDIYSEWKQWAISNLQFLPAMRTIGGDSVGDGLFVGDVYFLINGWQISTPPNNLNVSGVIYHDDAIPVFVVDPGGSVVSTVSSLVQTVETGGSTGGSSLTKQDVRDAMVLGTSLPPSANSIDQKLDDSITAHQTNALVTNDIQSRITSLQFSLGQTTELIEILLKYSRNRTRVDTDDNTLTVYEDDGTTAIRVFDLLDRNGAPSSDDVVERLPR